MKLTTEALFTLYTDRLDDDDKKQFIKKIITILTQVGEQLEIMGNSILKDVAEKLKRFPGFCYDKELSMDFTTEDNYLFIDLPYIGSSDCPKITPSIRGLIYMGVWIYRREQVKRLFPWNKVDEMIEFIAKDIENN